MLEPRFCRKDFTEYGRCRDGERFQLSRIPHVIKAAEGSRTPGRFAFVVSRAYRRQVLECGCPLPPLLELRRAPDSCDCTRLSFFRALLFISVSRNALQTHHRSANQSSSCCCFEAAHRDRFLRRCHPDYRAQDRHGTRLCRGMRGG